MRELIKYGANVNHQDHKGYTPMHSSFLMMHDDITRELFLNGADHTIKNIFGLNALHGHEERRMKFLWEFEPEIKEPSVE